MSLFFFQLSECPLFQQNCRRDASEDKRKYGLQLFPMLRCIRLKEKRIGICHDMLRLEIERRHISE